MRVVVVRCGGFLHHQLAAFTALDGLQVTNHCYDDVHDLQDNE